MQSLFEDISSVSYKEHTMNQNADTTTHEHKGRPRATSSSGPLLATREVLKRSANEGDVNGSFSFGSHFGYSKDDIDDIQRKLEERIYEVEQIREPNKSFDLSDLLPHFTDGMRLLTEDSFTKCFTTLEEEPWNWTFYLYPLWLLGLFLRYGVFFPIRLFCLVVGTFLFALAFIYASMQADTQKRQKLQRKCISFYCFIFVLSWTGVVKYHGVKPRRRDRKPNEVYVANHTSIIDIVVLQQDGLCYSIVGQKHPGLVGFVQKYILGCLGCLWFDRTTTKDRQAVSRKIKEHLQDPDNNPLLIFPEGTCVNNEYCVMFKKGAFELDAVVYPIAIKYNHLFCDAFWNSRKQSFLHHLFRLMTSWALVCDVWYLEPQTRMEGESSTDFANRVKEMIARQAGLCNVHWDGYLKYFRPSKRFIEERQKLFAKQLRNSNLARFTAAAAAKSTDAASPQKPSHEQQIRHRHLQQQQMPQLSIGQAEEMYLEAGTQDITKIRCGSDKLCPNPIVAEVNKRIKRSRSTSLPL